MANATNIQICDYHNGVMYNNWGAISRGITVTAGYGWNSQNWVTAIKFSLLSPATSVTWQWYTVGGTGGFGDLKYKVTQGENPAYVNATASTAGDGTFTASLDQYGLNTLTITQNFAANTEYVIYLWTNRSTSYNSFVQLRVYTSTYPMSVTYAEAAKYTLAIQTSSGITLSAALYSSPYGRSGSLSSGAPIYVNEVVQITYSVATGYALSTHTANGAAFNSDATFDVSGNLSVIVQAAYAISTISTGNGTFGTAQTIAVTRYGSSYTHTIVATCAGRSQTIATKSSSLSISWTPDVSMMNYITSSMSASCTLTCTTYSGDTAIGTSQITVTLSLPTSGTYSVKPTPSLSVSDPTGYATTFGGYVQGKSKIAVNVSDGLKYNSSASTRNTTANGAAYSAASFTTNAIISASQTAISTTIKDSRGQTGTASTSITILPYENPQITAFAVHRCNAQGVADDNGNYFNCTWGIAISALNNLNAKSIALQYKKVGASTWTDAPPITLTSYTQTGTTSAIAISTETSYDVRLVLQDSFSSATQQTQLSTIAATLDLLNNGKGAAFGKVAETANLLDVAWDERVRGSLTVDGGIAFPGVLRTVIPANSDLNDYYQSGYYVCGSSANAATMGHLPFSTAFLLDVYRTTGGISTSPAQNWLYVTQRFESLYGDVYMRTGQTGATTTVTWGEWTRLVNESDFVNGSNDIDIDPSPTALTDIGTIALPAQKKILRVSLHYTNSSPQYLGLGNQYYIKYGQAQVIPGRTTQDLSVTTLLDASVTAVHVYGQWQSTAQNAWEYFYKCLPD